MKLRREAGYLMTSPDAPGSTAVGADPPMATVGEKHGTKNDDW
jgi:hypothetical protein